MSKLKLVAAPASCPEQSAHILASGSSALPAVKPAILHVRTFLRSLSPSRRSPAMLIFVIFFWSLETCRFALDRPIAEVLICLTSSHQSSYQSTTKGGDVHTASVATSCWGSLEDV